MNRRHIYMAAVFCVAAVSTAGCEKKNDDAEARAVIQDGVQQIEKASLSTDIGCNPVPLEFEQDEDTVKISTVYLDENAELFINWKKRI